MVDTATNVFRSQYGDNLYELVEQKGSRLMTTVMNKPIVSAEDAYFDRIGSATARRKTTRHALSEPSDIPLSRRKMYLLDFYSEAWLDHEDQLRMIVDPKSKFAMRQASALGREIDDRIIAAATGNATAVDEDYGVSTVALPSGQYGNKDTGGADSGLSVEKLLEARRIYDANDCDEQAIRTCVYGAADKEALLNTTEVGSRDFNSVHALVTGNVDNFAGFRFVMCNRLLGAGTSGDPRLVLTYEQDAIGLAFLQNIMTRMVEDSDRHFMWKVYSKMTAEAIRVEEERVVVIKTVD